MKTSAADKAAVRRFLRARGSLVLELSTPLRTYFTLAPPKLDKAFPSWWAFLRLGELDIYYADEETRVDAITKYAVEQRGKRVSA
ncbi:MAG: hypothetical protein SVR04_10020 [Spirochaetota bacterium]|nr:hypothetical protein [Spirochaetota bacterium]